MHAKTILYLPTALQTYEALVDVGSNVGMNMQVECLDADFVDQFVNLALQLVCEKYTSGSLPPGATKKREILR